MKTKNKVLILVGIIIIIIGIVITVTKGFNFDLRYEGGKRIELNLQKTFESSDIKQIAKEVENLTNFSHGTRRNQITQYMTIPEIIRKLVLPNINNNTYDAHNDNEIIPNSDPDDDDDSSSSSSSDDDDNETSSSQEESSSANDSSESDD